MTGDVADCLAGEFRFPARQVTISFSNSENRNWIRHVQISTEGIFVKSLGNGFVLPHEEFMKVSSVCEPKTTYPPKLKSKPSLTVEFSSELKLTLQWEASDSLEAGKQKWTPIEGQTSATLDPSKVSKGQFVRCIGKNDAGTFQTPPIPI